MKSGTFSNIMFVLSVISLLGAFIAFLYNNVEVVTIRLILCLAFAIFINGDPIDD
jgi:hypothetical protein